LVTVVAVGGGWWRLVAAAQTVQGLRELDEVCAAVV
jgi:hypothetical protein